MLQTLTPSKFLTGSSKVQRTIRSLCALAILFAGLQTQNVQAQVANYGYSEAQGVFTPLGANATYILGNSLSSTQYFVDPANLVGGTVQTGPGFPIGFPFFYNSVMFDRLGVHFNGWISLGNSFVTPSVNMATSSITTPLSSTTIVSPPEFRARIAHAGNLFTNSNFPIQIGTTGPVGSRVCTIEFNNMRGGAGSDMTYQIKLYEGTNKIEIVYGPFTFGTGSTTFQVGLGGFVPTDFNNRQTTTNWMATVPGTTNTATCVGSSTTIPPTPGFIMAWYPAVPCNGFVTAGNTTGPDSACFGVPFTLATVNGIFSSGVTYQWQRDTLSTPLGYFNIAGATASTYSTTQTLSTRYRLRIICAASNDTSYSAPWTVYQKNFLNCYCNTSLATSPQFEEIFNVTLGSLNNNTNCGNSNNQYSDFRGIIPAPNLAAGTSYPLALTLTSCTPNLATRGVRVWIDYNQSGIFGDSTGEIVFTNNYASTIPDPVFVNTSTTIPTTARNGITAMRVVYARGGAPTNPCASYTNGETEDYYVNIVNIFKPVISGDTNVCAFSPVTLAATAPPGASTTWIPPNGQPTTYGPTLNIPSAQAVNAGVYRVINNIGTTYSDTTYFTLVVRPKPLPPYVPPGGSRVCQYEQYYNFGVQGQNILWYTTQVGGFGTPVQPTVNTSAPNVYSFYATQTVNGCESDRTLVLVTINLKPAPPKVISPLIYCQYDAERVMPVIGQNIKWYNAPSGGVGSIVTPSINTGYIDTFTYYLTQTVGGCESDRVRFDIMIVSKPNGTILANNSFVCQYDTIGFNYFGSAPAGARYFWAAAGGVIESGDNSAGPLIVRYNSPGVYKVTLTVALGGCVSDEAVKEITVRPAPTAQISAPDRACLNEQVNVVLIDVTPGSETYTWDFQGGQINFGSEGGPYGITWATTGDKVITLIVKNDECNSLPITDTVKVLPLPNADILYAPGSICAGQISAFEAANNAYYGYLWTPVEAFTTNNNHKVFSSVQKTGYVYVTVTSPEGCIAMDSAYVDVQNCCDVFIPNAFSPNGDGVNDLFRVRSEGTQEVSVFRVVNRYGQTMFETSDQLKGWDGTFSGKPQDIGTYHYFIRYKCGDGKFYEKKGDLNLIK